MYWVMNINVNITIRSCYNYQWFRLEYCVLQSRLHIIEKSICQNQLPKIPWNNERSFSWKITKINSSSFLWVKGLPGESKLFPSSSSRVSLVISILKLSWELPVRIAYNKDTLSETLDLKWKTFIVNKLECKC